MDFDQTIDWRKLMKKKIVRAKLSRDLDELTSYFAELLEELITFDEETMLKKAGECINFLSGYQYLIDNGFLILLFKFQVSLPHVFYLLKMINKQSQLARRLIAMKQIGGSFHGFINQHELVYDVNFETLVFDGDIRHKSYLNLMTTQLFDEIEYNDIMSHIITLSINKIFKIIYFKESQRAFYHN